MRDNRIEILRVVLMFFVVVHHCCLLGPIQDNTLVKIVSTITRFHVDAFVLISGWFGVRLKIRKIVSLFGLGVFSVAFIGIVGGCLGYGWDFRFSLGWFGNSYIALLLLSPLINAGVNALKNEGENVLLTAWCCYAIAMLISWFPGVGLNVSGWHGHSFNTILFVYVTGRIMALCGNSRFLKWMYHGKIVLFLLLLFEIVNLSWAAWAINSIRFRIVLLEARDYNAPFVIGMAICVFLLSMKLPQIGSNKYYDLVLKWGGGGASQAMFSVYILHNGVPNNTHVKLYGRLISYLNEGVQSQFFELISIFVTALIIMLVCVFVDFLRRILLKMIVERFMRKIWKASVVERMN